MAEKDDKKEAEGAKETDAPEDKPVGNTPQETETTDFEDAANERLENIERTLARMEKAGRAEAAIPTPKEPVKTPEEFAQDFLDGKVENPLKE